MRHPKGAWDTAEVLCATLGPRTLGRGPRMRRVTKNHPKFHAKFKKCGCEKVVWHIFLLELVKVSTIRKLKTPSVQCTAMNCPSFKTGKFYLLRVQSLTDRGIHEIQ